MDGSRKARSKNRLIVCIGKTASGFEKGSKTATVKEALKEAIVREQKQLPIRERLAKTFALMEELGPLPHRDHKKDMDELWAEED